MAWVGWDWRGETSPNKDGAAIVILAQNFHKAMDTCKYRRKYINNPGAATGRGRPAFYVLVDATQ